jgi:hypothetical protein
LVLHHRIPASFDVIVRWSMIRIYADFNGLVRSPRNSARTAVVLDTFGSLRDLSNAGLVLSERLPLIAVDWSDENEDLEGHGTAQYDRERRWWVVEFDETGVRYVPAGNRDPVKEFRCVACRRALSINAPSDAFNPGGRCASCGTRFMAAYAPPPLTKGNR